MTWEPLQHARDGIAEHPDIHTWDMALLDTGKKRIVSPIVGHEAASVKDLLQLVRRTPEGRKTSGGWLAAFLPMAGGDLWIHHTPKSTQVAFRRPGQEPVPVKPGDPRLKELAVASLCKRVQAMLDGVLVQEDAMGLVAKALQATPGYPPALKIKARLHQAQGDNASALRILKELVDKRQDAEAHYMMADALDELDRPDEALAAYDKALRIRPDYLEVWGDRGMLLKKMGREKEAYDSYERALHIDPGNPGTRLNAAIGHFNSGRIEQAKKHLVEMDHERANEQQAKMAGALASEVLNHGLRDEAWQETGGFLESLPWFCKDNPGVLYARGVCAMKLGKKADARKDLQAALRLAPEFDQARAALQEVGR